MFRLSLQVQRYRRLPVRPHQDHSQMNRVRLAYFQCHPGDRVDEKGVDRSTAETLSHPLGHLEQAKLADFLGAQTECLGEQANSNVSKG